MCGVSEVLKSTNESGAVIVSTVHEYGNDSLGGGILKLAKEMYDEGFSDGVSLGFSAGQSEGVIKGVVATVCVLGVAALGYFGFKKHAEIHKKKNSTLPQKKNEKEIKDGKEQTGSY